MPVYLIRRNLPHRKRSKFSEKRAAAILGGRLQPASGSLSRHDWKADVKSKHFLMDDKTTQSGAFTINLKKWRTLYRQAFTNNRMPVMRVEFSEGATCYILDEFGFNEFLDYMNTKKP